MDFIGWYANKFEMVFTDTYKQRLIAEYLQPPPIQSVRVDIKDCDLSIRAINCLSALEIKYIDELTKYSKRELLKFRYIGKKTMVELDEKLESLGLSFKK